MRPALLLLAFLAMSPFAAGDEEQDASVGVNLGYFAPGVWQAFDFATPGGPVTITLTWEETGVFPFADYDLRLYRPGALDDEQLRDHELIAQSSNHPYRPHSERIDVGLAPATYVIAVAPFQTQGERYTLRADPGDLTHFASLVGYSRFE